MKAQRSSSRKARKDQLTVDGKAREEESLPATTPAARCELGLATGAALVRSMELVETLLVEAKTVLVDKIALVGMMVLWVAATVGACVIACALTIWVTLVMPTVAASCSVALNHAMMLFMAWLERLPQRLIN